MRLSVCLERKSSVRRYSYSGKRENELMLSLGLWSRLSLTEDQSIVSFLLRTRLMVTT